MKKYFFTLLMLLSINFLSKNINAGCPVSTEASAEVKVEEPAATVDVVASEATKSVEDAAMPIPGQDDLEEDDSEDIDVEESEENVK